MKRVQEEFRPSAPALVCAATVACALGVAPQIALAEEVSVDDSAVNVAVGAVADTSQVVEVAEVVGDGSDEGDGEEVSAVPAEDEGGATVTDADDVADTDADAPTKDERATAEPVESVDTDASADPEVTVETAPTVETTEETSSVDGAEGVAQVEASAQTKVSQSNTPQVNATVVHTTITVSTNVANYRDQWVKSADGSYCWYDAQGRLQTSGWVVTSKRFDGTDKGELQRYYINPATRACATGKFSVGDYDYYAAPGDGWVLRGSGNIDGKTYYADEDGRIVNTVVASASVKNSGDATNLESTYVGDTMYLFLPSYASLSQAPLAAERWAGATDIYLSGSETGTFQRYASFSKIDISSISQNKDSNGAILLAYKTSATSVARKLAIMISSDVTSVFVLSKDSDKGRGYVESSPDHTLKADVAVVVVAPDGTVVYNKDDAASGATSTIKGRGNSTWQYGNKKPYQISLNKKADLLQTGNKDNAKKKWVLLANANDSTLLHDTIAYNTALELGLVGTECTPVDLWYDGEYRGSYLLCEKIEVNGGRVDIFDLEDAFEDANDGVDLDSKPTAQSINRFGYDFQYAVGVANPDDYSGGYLLELDSAWYASETCWFKTSVGTFVIKSPEVCSLEAVKYISEVVQRALYELKFDQSSAYIFDMASFAKALLINEFFKNVDYGASSTYFYLDRGSKSLVASPVWDFDGSMGTRSDTPSGAGEYDFATYHGYMENANDWMIGIPKVQAAVKGVWNSGFSSLVGKVLLGGENAVGSKGFLRSISYYSKQVSASQKMNQVLFGLTSFDNEFTPYGTYAENLAYLIEWLTNRFAWFMDNFASLNGTAKTSAALFGGVDYGIVFDASYYKKMNPDVVAAYGDSDEAAFAHFLAYGMAEGRTASRNFDVRCYAALNADLRAAFGNNLAAYYTHYATYGFKEGRKGK